MKALIYSVAAGLLLVLLVVLAVAIAHLPWWGALLLVVVAMLVASGVALMAFGMSVAHPLITGGVMLVEADIRVTRVARGERVPGAAGEVVVYWIDATVTPGRRRLQTQTWAPDDMEVALLADVAPVGWARRRQVLRRVLRPLSVNIPAVPVTERLVRDGDGYVPLEHALLEGPQSFRLRCELPAKTRRAALRIGGVWSDPIVLPGDGSADDAGDGR